MRRELIIEKTDGAGDWMRLDLGEEVPAMVFQVNDFNDLKDRQTSYSQALELPITPNNCRVFGFANEFDAQSSTPYSIHRCAWYEDGAQIIGTDFRLELLSVSDVFNCQIVSNLLGLFETLQSLAMDDLTMSPILWNHNTVKATLESDNPDQLYTFAPPVCVRREAGVYNQLAVGTSLVAGVLPYFRLLPLVREILRQAGYALETDIESVPGYESDLISMCDFKPGPDSFTPLTGRATGADVAIATGSAPTYPISLLNDITDSTFDYNEVRVISLRDANVPAETTTGYEYVAPGYMKCRVRLTALSNSTTDTDSRVRYRIQKFGNPDPSPASSDYEQDVIAEVDDVRVGNLTNYEAYISDEIELAPGERLYLEILLLQGTEGLTFTGHFNLQIPAENAVPAGGNIYPQKSTDFKNQLDVIRLFVQLYGLFVDVDTDARTVRAYNFNKIVDRVKSGDFADWSGKLDIRQSQETTFRVGSYEQQNRILFGNNDLLDIQKAGAIHVNNANLLATKDIFTLAVESSENQQDYPPISLPQLQDMEVDIRYTQDDGKGWNYLNANQPSNPWTVPLVSYRASKTHIVRLEKMQSGSTSGGTFQFGMIPPGYTAAGAYVDGAYAFVPASVDPQTFIDTYYPILEANILNPARVVEAVFNLTPSDIENLDLLRPVYISEYGAFFYIQKINNYQARKLTKVTLVCLNVTTD